MTGFLFVLLPILVVVGAFNWMRPSKRDQTLAKLRSDALLNGFRIGSMKIPDFSEFGRINDKSRIVTIYQKQLDYIKQGSPLLFTAARTSGECGAYLPDQWDWVHRDNLTEDSCRQVGDLLRQLPSSVEVLTLNSDSVAISWDEADPDITFEQLDCWISDAAHSFGRTVLGRNEVVSGQ